VVTNWQDAIEMLFGGFERVQEGFPHSGVSRLEARLGIVLPECLIVIASVIEEDESRSFYLGDFRWMAACEIEQVWNRHAEFAQSSVVVDESLASNWDVRIQRIVFHEQRVPIAEYNGDLWLCLDYSPTASGVRGQVILIDPEGLSWRWLANSLDQLVVDAANGTFVCADFSSDADSGSDHDPGVPNLPPSNEIR
jgi:cell wall assembly regulator SMI1